ncbi:ferric reductase-like transmembrane domain-containing protein [Catellatospora paridis]|uniref:ferric reductase-like transmembrane domain-containing protein n=1 Tax=Catellatospora paridis TaxID=1617086 RepID=UPI0018AFE39D|nr:ferric reductase-like transmembrane domain-containing protein [Catellatospora paridis]
MESAHVIAATVGFTSFGLLWLAVLGGVALRNGWGLSRIRRSVAYAAHQGIALIGLTLGLVHGIAQLAVPNGTISVVEVIVPFVDTHDPVGVGAGVLGLELVLAGAISIVIQRRLGFSRWRAVHMATYVGFSLVSAHVLISGTDTGPAWVWGPVYTAWLATVALWFTTWPRRNRRVESDNVLATMRPEQPRDSLVVDVDPVRCARFGFCEQESPAVFSLRSDGRLDYTAAPPAYRLEEVVRAVEVCPARAISVRRPAGTAPAAPVPPAAPVTPLITRQRERERVATPPADYDDDDRRPAFEPATELDEFRQRARHSRAQHRPARDRFHVADLTSEDQP